MASMHCKLSLPDSLESWLEWCVLSLIDRLVPRRVGMSGLILPLTALLCVVTPQACSPLHHGNSLQFEGRAHETVFYLNMYKQAFRSNTLTPTGSTCLQLWQALRVKAWFLPFLETLF